MAILQPYHKYYPVAYDYATQLPDSWQLLPNIAIFQERIERGYENEELLSVTIGRGVIRQTDVDIKKDSSNEDKSKYKLIKVGDIAYNKMRMWQGALGYSDFQGISSPAYVILKPKMKINPRYFHYMFRTAFYTNYSKRFSYGIVDDQLSLRYTDFKRMYSIVPPLSVQNTIVAYLNKKNNEIDKFIRNKERLIELLEGQKKRIIYEYVTKGIKKDRAFIDFEVGIFGKIPKDWIVSKLKYVCYNLNNRRIPLESVERGRMTNRIYDYYGATGVIDQVEDYIFDETTILVAEDGANLVSRNLQLVYVATGKYWVNNHSHIIKPRNNMNLYYLSYLLDLTDYNPFITGSTQPKLTKDAFMSTIVVRPTIEEQNEIIKRIDIEIAPINLAISKAQKEISSIKEYREAIITDLVTGRRSVPQLQMS